MTVFIPDNSTTYKAALGDLDGKQSDATVVIGGADPVKAVPNINASKWDDEAWINLNYKKMVVSIEPLSFTNGELSLTVGGTIWKTWITDIDVNLIESPITLKAVQ